MRSINIHHSILYIWKMGYDKLKKQNRTKTKLKLGLEEDTLKLIEFR